MRAFKNCNLAPKLYCAKYKIDKKKTETETEANKIDTPW